MPTSTRCRFVKSTYDGAGCTVGGLKRAKGLTTHAATDARRNVLELKVCGVRTHDACAAELLLRRAAASFPSLQFALGDNACAGEALRVFAAQLGVPLDVSSPLLRWLAPIPHCNFCAGSLDGLLHSPHARFEGLGPRPHRAILRLARALAAHRANVASGIAAYAMGLVWPAFGLRLRREARGIVA